MLEESISCSPECEINRSQFRRFHKRLKGRYSRRKEPTSFTDISRLEGLYEESSNGLNSTQYEHFNPFENEQLLAAADMVRVPKSSTSIELFSKGFVKLEELPVKEDDFQEQIQEPAVISSPDQIQSDSHPPYGPETQFGITESEFVRFCDDAEMDAKEPTTTARETPQNKKTIVDMILEDFCSSQSSEDSPNVVKELAPSETPQNKKSIVDAILEDFCSSPYSESPPNVIGENATPIFRFRSKPMRTYSGTRRRRLRRNIDVELANAHLTDEDDGSVSDSSGLSVQEDFTQSVVPQLDTVDLNNSIRVCENLLNLSSYFSQATSHTKTPQSSEEQKTRSISEVVEEIMQLKRRSYEVTRRKSLDEFYGFSDGDSIEEFYGFSDDERKTHEDTLKELLDAEGDILEQINCDSLCYEKVQPKSSFSYNASELEINLQKAKSVIEDARKFMQSLESMHGAGVSDRSPTVCDSLKSLPRVLPQDSPVKEEKLFEDVDLWNDNDCLLNYVTQKPTLKQENCRIEEQVGDAECSGFSTASKKPIAISEAAKRKASELMSKFDEVETERHEGGNGVDVISCEDGAQSGGDEVVFVGFTTASRKPVIVSEAARLKADLILRQFEEEEQAPSTNTSHKKPGATCDERRGVVSSVKGSVSNEISDEAKLKAEELLKDIEFFDDGFEEESEAKDPAPQKLQPAFEGFKTTSRKSIVVADDAKRRADRLIKEIQTEDVPRDFLECIQGDLNHEPRVNPSLKEGAKEEMTFEGFTTASRKPIEVSEVAKRKAEQILKDVQIDQMPQEFIECIEADLKSNDCSLAAGKEQGPTEVVFEGFKTASKKPIQISDVAKQRAAQMLKEVESTDLPQEFLKCIQADLKEDTVVSVDVDKCVFQGFRTASMKSIQISEAAKQRAEKLLKEIEAEALPAGLVECIQSNSVTDAISKVEATDSKRQTIATKYVNEEEELLAISLQGTKETTPPLETSPQRTKETTAPLATSPQRTNEPTNRKTIKRKSEVFPSETLLKSPKRRFSCTERTPLNGIENAPLHKTSSHPDIKSKKNLLSLSKRKKYNSPKVPKTPEKQDSSVLRCNTNTTPNLKEFFDCVTTSTPRLIRGNSCKADKNHKDSSIDGDFQKINWESANSSSARLCQTKSFTDLNVTCVEVSPSPKQRIERLKMYGEPPPISPILLVNKCRPSGLRRGRSLMKP